MKLLGVADVVALLPMSPGSGFGGSWLGWMLRSTLAPLIGYENARNVVVRAIGPGHDWQAPEHGNETGRRNTVARSDKGKKRRNYARLAQLVR